MNPSSSAGRQLVYNYFRASVRTYITFSVFGNDFVVIGLIGSQDVSRTLWEGVLLVPWAELVIQIARII